MDNKARAEKILSLCNMPTTDSAYSDPRNGLSLFLKRDIIRELDEACAEAREVKIRDEYNLVDGLREKAFMEGFASAVEKAAGIAIEIGDLSCGFPEFSREIANRIRALRAEEK